MPKGVLYYERKCSCHHEGAGSLQRRRLPLWASLPGAGVRTGRHHYQKPRGCGICAGDVKAYNGGLNFWGDGTNPPSLTTPTIGGHEIIGTIVKMGPGVEKKEPTVVADNDFKLGDLGCGRTSRTLRRMRYCKEGRYSLCVPHNVYRALRGIFGEASRNMPSWQKIPWFIKFLRICPWNWLWSLSPTLALWTRSIGRGFNQMTLW